MIAKGFALTYQTDRQLSQDINMFDMFGVTVLRIDDEFQIGRSMSEQVVGRYDIYQIIKIAKIIIRSTNINSNGVTLDPNGARIMHSKKKQLRMKLILKSDFNTINHQMMNTTNLRKLGREMLSWAENMAVSEIMDD